MQCAEHPKIETNLTCGKCEKPICPKCMVQTPVGIRCKECANVKSLPTYQIPTLYYLRASGAGIGIGIICGLAWWAVYLILPFFFILRFFVAAGVGYAIGEIISISVNRKRGIGLAVIGGISAALSFIIANVLLIPLSWNDLRSILFGLLVLAVTIFMAVRRLW
jgi:hypothetical protein